MHRARVSKKAITVVAVGVLVSATALSQAVDVSAAATKSGTGHERVIVVMHNQLGSTPARRGAAKMAARTALANQSQAAVLSRISGPAPSHVVHFSVANAFAATVDASQAASLAADPSVQSVVKDEAIPLPTPGIAPAASPNRGLGRVDNLTPDVDGPDAVCPSDPSQPLVEPEALRSIHALTTDGSNNAQDLNEGGGVTVAYIADGIDPDNPDFIRENSDHVIIDYQDFSGDGPNAPSGGVEAFGDASSIAAQGTVSHDLSNFVNQSYPLPPGCNVRIVGVAPDASIVALKAGGSQGLAASSVLQSIDYAVRVDHVDVLNESFGVNQFPDDSVRNTIELFNDQAVAAGVTVTVATGDGGVTSTIASDAQDPNVISVGATTDNRSYAQTGYAGARFFANGQWVSDNISALSSGGFTQRGRTADLVAPGEGNWAVCEPGFLGCNTFRSPATPADVQDFGGTSESAPLTAGVAALVISAYRSTHNGDSPSPQTVKQIITGTASDLGLPPSEQGSGLLNARAAVEAALTSPGSTVTEPPAVQSRFTTSRDQQTLEGLPGSTVSGSVDVTNEGQTAIDVAEGSRTFQTIAQTAQATAFNSTTLPTFPNSNGQPTAYKQVHFSVPAGANRLEANMAWAGSTPSVPDKIVRLSLIAPDGTFVANSLPQGGGASADYANVDVRNPASGTWTALMTSIAGSNGYTGVIGLATTSERAIGVGSVSPATLHLAPGETKTVNYHFKVPSKAGDQSYAVAIASSTGQQTAVGVVVRPLIDTSSGSGTFKGAVTGGNGRPGAPAQMFSYDFDVPDNAPSLNVTTTFNHNPNSVMDMVLVDPAGEVSDVVTNLTPDAKGTTETIARKIQSFTASPLAGRWNLVVVVQNPVTGTAFDEPFSGKINFAAVPVTTGGLPNDPATQLPRNVPAHYQVTVTNSGGQAILVGADPRTTDAQDLQAVPLQGQSTFALPAQPSNEPIYVVPPDTDQLTVTALSTTPAQLELYSSANGFDLFGDLAAAQGGNLLSTAEVSESGAGAFISRGIWFTNMQEIGPFTDAGETAGQSTLTASIHTLGFDPDVTTSTRDPYGVAVDPTNNGFGHPLRITPGHTKTINVTITPSAATGTDVTGLLNIVTVSTFPAGFTSLPQVTTGEVIATIPYEYTVN